MSASYEEDRGQALTDAIQRIEAGLGEFVTREGARVAVVARGTEWDRLAEDARRISAETEVLGRALGGGDRFEAVQRDRMAAAAAFDRPEADRAVVATVDGRLVAVAACRTQRDRLEILTEGATHRTDGDSESARLAVQHTVARAAARVGLEVRAHAPSDPGQWPAFEARQQLLGRLPAATDARWWQADRAYSWSAPDTRRVVREAVVVQPDGGLDRLDVLSGSEDLHYQAADVAEFLESGGRVRVVRHADPPELVDGDLDGHATAARAVLSITQATGADWDDAFGTQADPARVPQLVTFLAERDGIALATLTYAENADELLVVQNNALARGGSNPVDRGAVSVVQHALLCEAQRRTMPARYEREPSVNWTVADASRDAAVMNLRLGPLADQLPVTAFTDVPGAERARVAATLARFDAGLGDVVVVRPDGTDQLFRRYRQQALELAAATGGERVFADGSEFFVHAFEPPRDDAGVPFVAVAVRDGQPVAAVRYYVAPDRIVLDTAGALPGSATASDDLTAATVEGPLRATDGRRVAGAVPGSVAAAYRGAGVGSADRGPVDGFPGLATVELTGGSARQLVTAVDAERGEGRRGPREVELIAGNLIGFEVLGRELAVLDHADPDDRRRAEHVTGASSGASPESADRVTVVALEGGEPTAFMTVDSPPGQPITIADWNATGIDTTRDAAMLWWLANHQARLDRPMTESDAVARFSYGSGVMDPEQSRYLVNGIHNRVQDRFDPVAAGAGADRPSTNAEAVRMPAPQQESGDKGKRSSGRHKPRSREGGAER